MNRISSLFVASALAVLPISAFAQQVTAPAKIGAPASMTPATTAPVNGKMSDTAAATVTQPSKTDNKMPTQSKKNEVHGMNGMKSHVVKSNILHAKTELPAKS